jgi:hypothetical protein
MPEVLPTERARPQLVRAAQVAREAEVRQSPNGVRFATYGETGVDLPDLDRMLQAVPTAIVAALRAHTYYFVPLALRENSEPTTANEAAMVAGSYTDEYGDAAICHRDVELGSGKRGVFISTRLMGDRFALSFEFFINVAHAFVEEAGVPASFAELAWSQAQANVRGETSMDAWESRNLALGRSAKAEVVSPSRRTRAFAVTTPVSGGASMSAAAGKSVAADDKRAADAVDEKERNLFLDAAFSDAIAIYLLSLTLDFDYSELREREYPLLAPATLALRLKHIAELFPPNESYEFAVRYRRRA